MVRRMHPVPLRSWPRTPHAEQIQGERRRCCQRCDPLVPNRSLQSTGRPLHFLADTDNLTARLRPTHRTGRWQTLFRASARVTNLPRSEPLGQRPVPTLKTRYASASQQGNTYARRGRGSVRLPDLAATWTASIRSRTPRLHQTFAVSSEPGPLSTLSPVRYLAASEGVNSAGTGCFRQ